MIEWLKDKVLGPFIMFIIASLSAGTWAIVLIILNNQGESERHDTLIEGNNKLIERLAVDVKKLVEGQAEIKFLRRDVDRLTTGFDNAHK